jgi:hypothetical protein
VVVMLQFAARSPLLSSAGRILTNPAYPSGVTGSARGHPLALRYLPKCGTVKAIRPLSPL